jgi:transcription initiation factor TFIID subunit 15
MVSKSLIWAAAIFGAAQAANNANTGTATTGSSAQNVLDPAVIQTGSFFDGSDGLGAEAGQALSATSQNNFIDFCKGQTLTNGLQIVQGSCNQIRMSYSCAHRLWDFY